jgi:hypothetical protein
MALAERRAQLALDLAGDCARVHAGGRMNVDIADLDGRACAGRAAATRQISAPDHAARHAGLEKLGPALVDLIKETGAHNTATVATGHAACPNSFAQNGLTRSPSELITTNAPRVFATL